MIWSSRHTTPLSKLFWVAMALSISTFGPAKASNEVLGSLSEAMAKRPNWSKDPSEVAYVAARCGSLITMLGGYLKANAARPEDEVNGEKLSQRGQPFFLSALLMGQLSKMDEEATFSRYADLSKNYAQLLASNKRLHNNVFHEPVLADFNFCLDLEKTFIALTKMFEQAQESKK